MTSTAFEQGKGLGSKAVRSPIFWLAIVAGLVWWQFSPMADDETLSVLQRELAAQPAVSQLSEEQRYSMAMVDPARAKAIREAADRRSLVIAMREIELATAAALRQNDAREFKIQTQYAGLAMARMAQIPDAEGGKDFDCVDAAISLHSLLDEVARGYSPARAEQAYSANAPRWQKTMTSCERGVGLKPVSRQL